MDQLRCASLSRTNHWYEVGMLKAPANACVYGHHFADVMTTFSVVSFVLVLLRFRLFAFIEAAAALRSIVFDMQAPRKPHVFFVFFFLFLLIWRCRFFRVFLVPLLLSLCIGEYVVRCFLPNVVFLSCDHGLDFLHQLM